MEAAPRTQQKYIVAFDGVRGLAVILVFLLHTAGGASSSQPLLRLFGNAIKVGWSGVTLFFLLSGFLITGILWDSKGEPHWWRNFYLRRALRILPLYYGVLVLLLIVSCFDGTLRAVAHNVWVLFAYLQNVPPFWTKSAFIPSPLFVYHLWSIAVEEQFYLFWPILIFFTRTKKQAAVCCALTFCMSFAFRFLVFDHLNDSGPLSTLLPSRAGELALGGLLGLTYRTRWWRRLVPWLPAILCGSALVFAALAWQVGVSLSSKWPFTLGLASCTVAWAAFLALSVEPGLVQRAMSVGWLRWIGRISYGAYVYHVLLIALFTQIALAITHRGAGDAFAGTRFVVAIVGTLLISWLSFRFYEKPFLRLKKYF